MEEEVTKKVPLKTYSRTRNRDRKNDVVFSEKAFQSLKQNIFSPDDKIPASDKGKRKRQRRTSNLSRHGSLKKLKQGQNKKAILQVKIQRKPPNDLRSLERDDFKEDVLFGDDIQPVRTRKKANARRSLKDKAITKPSVKGSQKRGSTKMAVSTDQNKESVLKLMNSVEKKEGLPPEAEMRSKDKVSDWLARSDKNRSQHSESSKEIWREEQQFTGDEMRNELFPDEFFENLNQVLQKPELRPAKINKHAKDKFLSQLALTSIDVGSEPQTAETENLMSCSIVDDDVTFMCIDTQSGTQTGTHTETGTKCYTTGTATSKYMESQSQTGFSRKSTDHWTDEWTAAQTETTNTNITETKTDSPSYGLQPSTKSLKVSAAGRSRSEGKDQTQVAASDQEVEQSIICKDVRVQKYLCSTMRRSASTSNVYFPAELSSVTDSLKTKQEDEKTPRRTTEEFKVPGSPMKCAAFKGVRKGTLQPKNSTKLFTSGFVEIVDVIPQMSTIINEPCSKTFSPEKQFMKTSYVVKEAPVHNKLQNIKTSTPNKVDSREQPFQFETDISSVNMDSEDDDLLVFHESREVNSEECIHLSDTVSFTQQDSTIVVDNDLQAAKEARKVSPDHKTTTCTSSNTKTKEDDMKDQPFPIQVTDTGDRIKVAGISKQKQTGVPKNLPQKSLRNKSATRRLGSGCYGVSQQSVEKKNSSSRQLSRNTEASCDIINNVEQSVLKRKKNYSEKQKGTISAHSQQTVSDVDIPLSDLSPVKNETDARMDIYDIDESVNNVPNPHVRRLARKKLLREKHKFKSLKENSEKYKKNVNSKSSETYFNPEGPLNFSCTSHLNSFPSDFARSKNSNTGKDRSMFSRAEKDSSVPICTLNKKFTCPKGRAPVFKYKTGDIRSCQEMIDSVTIDVLMW